MRASRPISRLGTIIALSSQPMKMLGELLTFCRAPMQSTSPAVARQIRLHEEIRGRDGEKGREVGGIEEEWESVCVRL